MQRAQLVAVGITQIRQVQRPGATLAHSRRILDRRPARRHAGRMPSIRLRRACHRKPDRPAIGMRRRLAVDRRGHQEHPAIMHIDQPPLGILHRGLAANRGKQRIVKRL